jgi:MinD-like ATPase involved in chromosome partitioning or flagellar assembly
METYTEIKTLKAQVEFVLQTRHETRNSDAELVTVVCGKFGLDPIKTASSIERCRRWFNQRMEYLPTDEKIAHQRKINIEEWRAAMGYKASKLNWAPPSKLNEPIITRVKSETYPYKDYIITDLGTSIECTCPRFTYHKTCKHVKKRSEQISLSFTQPLF